MSYIKDCKKKLPKPLKISTNKIIIENDSLHGELALAMHDCVLFKRSKLY